MLNCFKIKTYIFIVFSFKVIMRNSILSFVYNPKTRSFLLLNLAKSINHYPSGIRFIVCGEVDKKESCLAAAEREVKEGTGLDVNEIISLDWGSVYNWEGDEYKEMTFLTFVNSKDTKLGKKYSEYAWLSLREFISKISWNGNITLLKEVLKKGINKEVYFNKKERGQ